MESDLLLREDEFYKENEKLELKTKQLLLKVDDVMKIQDNLIRDTLKTQTELIEVNKTCFNKYNKNEHVFEETKVAPEEGVGVVKVYKAKLKSVLAEKERAQNELKQKNEEMKKLQKDNQLSKEEKDKWFLLYNSGKNAIGKLESQIFNLNSKLQCKDAENACLKKETEQLRKELKSLNFNSNNYEVRLTRTNEELDKVRTALKQAKEDEKDLKDNFRKQMNELTSNLKQTEKQKIELLNGFKKQIQLIDVLKQQKTLLEAAKVTEMTENDYLKILDWKFE